MFKIEKNIKLSDFCTFKTGGFAKYFVVIESIDDLKKAIDFAKQNQLPFFILGGGSNLLISDEGVNGLVIKMEIKGTTWEPSSQVVRVIAEAGESWDGLVLQAVNKNLYGIENLSYIPGTVGASAVQNIGAYGVEAKDTIDWVEVFDTKTGKIKRLKNKECQFGYRDSIFKKSEGKDLVVLKVAYNLKKDGELNDNYKDIREYLLKNEIDKSRASVKDMREILVKVRGRKFHNLDRVGTVGSFFKNNVISKKQLDELLKKYPELSHYPKRQESIEFYKVSLAYILDKILGWKGVRDGCVGVCSNQPMSLVNYGCGTTTDIKNLAQKIQNEVKQKTDIDIDFEVVEW